MHKVWCTDFEERCTDFEERCTDFEERCTDFENGVQILKTFGVQILKTFGVQILKMVYKLNICTFLFVWCTIFEKCYFTNGA